MVTLLHESPQRCDRNLHWLSSVRGDPATLATLDRQLAAFYGAPERRKLYQQMLDSQENETLPVGSVTDHLLHRIATEQPATVVEVGCGNGWLYRHLRKLGYRGKYTGMEVPEYLVRLLEDRHADASWLRGSTYKIPLGDEAVDVCFAFYVLEHTVYPERALREMLRVVRPGGLLMLAFPDFVTFGFLPSQLTGFSPGGARVKLAAGKALDAVVTLYDSRVRQRRGMQRVAAGAYGPFPVNTHPLCLSYPDLIWPDVDAVYVASKQEVATWATSQGYRVEFPCGVANYFAQHAYLTISK